MLKQAGNACLQKYIGVFNSQSNRETVWKINWCCRIYTMDLLWLMLNRETSNVKRERTRDWVIFLIIFITLSFHPSTLY
jgi:hypothetical protein